MKIDVGFMFVMQRAIHGKFLVECCSNQLGCWSHNTADCKR